MPRKLTTQEFIKRATILHGNKYDYNFVDYKYSTGPIKIICKIHGVFEQKPNNHINTTNPANCPKCANIIIDSKVTLTNEEFINRASKKHNNFYIYDKTDYKNHLIPIIIKCPIHGYFNLIPKYHMNGIGCKICSIIRREICYYRIKDKQGEKIPYNFYILRLFNDNENFYKIGISNNLNNRVKFFKYYKYDILYTVKGNVNECVTIEQDMLSSLKEYKYIPKIKFSGYTECFYINPIKILKLNKC